MIAGLVVFESEPYVYLDLGFLSRSPLIIYEVPEARDTERGHR